MSNPGHVLASCLSLAVLCAAWGPASAAAELKVRVLDRDGKPVTDVVVAAQLQPGAPAPAPPAPKVKTAVMDQVDRKFVPHILVIQTGTSVSFPNSDSVAHQVYSFSDTKRFQLPLYHGRIPPPQVFDKPGLVVLGCNIHDNMIGYIYVAPTPWFGKTDAAGAVTLNLPAGIYELSIWHPRFNEPEAQIKRKITVTADAPASLDVRLTKPLRAEPGSHSSDHDY